MKTAIAILLCCAIGASAGITNVNVTPPADSLPVAFTKINNNFQFLRTNAQGRSLSLMGLTVTNQITLVGITPPQIIITNTGYDTNFPDGDWIGDPGTGVFTNSVGTNGIIDVNTWWNHKYGTNWITPGGYDGSPHSVPAIEVQLNDTNIFNLYQIRVTNSTYNPSDMNGVYTWENRMFRKSMGGGKTNIIMFESEGLFFTNNPCWTHYYKDGSTTFLLSRSNLIGARAHISDSEEIFAVSYSTNGIKSEDMYPTNLGYFLSAGTTLGFNGWYRFAGIQFAALSSWDGIYLKWLFRDAPEVVTLTAIPPGLGAGSDGPVQVTDSFTGGVYGGFNTSTHRFTAAASGAVLPGPYAFPANSVLEYEEAANHYGMGFLIGANVSSPNTAFYEQDGVAYLTHTVDNVTKYLIYADNYMLQGALYVRQSDGFAYLEVFFPGVGWIRAKEMPFDDENEWAPYPPEL